MAEITKGAKAPAKPKKSTAKKSSGVEKSNGVEVQKRDPSSSEIAELAQKFWAERGHQDGYAEQDWLRAEQELRKA